VSAPVDVSVVVPTHNRAAQLDTVLCALRHEDAVGIACQILVVDNASTDASSSVVSRAAAKDSRVEYVFEPRQGASHARNAGIARARAPIVAFVDDDVVPARNWLRVLKSTFDAHPAIDCVGGRVEPRWPAHVPRWVAGTHVAPLALQTARPLDFDAEHASACLITANFACRRRVFDEIGGFSTDYDRDEDREFNLRLWRAGKRGRYVDELRVVARVAAERLTKRYYRRWYEATGRNHARMKFREIIDRDGRLVAPMTCRRVLGRPAFVWRECAAECLGWCVAMVRGTASGAFFHECRVRYFVSYLLG
jgi:glycosyltransferase involved in cell wall biosynthesis